MPITSAVKASLENGEYTQYNNAVTMRTCAGETYMILQQEEKKDVRNGRRKEQVAQILYGHSKLV